MRELPENIYVLNKPGDDITVIHMNNEINIFGKYTSIKTSQFVTYPPINDEPKTIANEDAYWRNAIIGTLVTVALGAVAIAVVATATVVTGGVALAAIALAGAAVGTGLVTAGAAKVDRESGSARDTSDFLMQLVTGGAIGAFVGATFYSIAPVLPQASSLMSAGICAEFGISSGAFGTALGYGITGVGAMALTGNTMLSYDQIYAMGSGESFLLDTLFDDDQNAYDTATVVCDSLTMGYMDMCMQYYAANAGAAATADDVDDGIGQGGTGSAKLGISTTTDNSVEQSNIKSSSVSKKSGLYMEEIENLDGDASSRILSTSDAEEHAFNAIKGSDNADSVVLGKFESDSPASYDVVAKDMDAQYFNLDNWDELSSKYSREEIWKINERFLDIQTSSDRGIYLSHNPANYIGDGSYYSQEIQYLIDNGYRFVQEGDIWHAVR